MPTADDARAVRCVEDGGLCPRKSRASATRRFVCMIFRERGLSLRELALLAETRAHRSRVVARCVAVTLAFVRGQEVVWLRRKAPNLGREHW